VKSLMQIIYQAQEINKTFKISMYLIILISYMQIIYGCGHQNENLYKKKFELLPEQDESLLLQDMKSNAFQFSKNHNYSIVHCNMDNTILKFTMGSMGLFRSRPVFPIEKPGINILLTAGMVTQLLYHNISKSESSNNIFYSNIKELHIYSAYSNSEDFKAVYIKGNIMIKKEQKIVFAQDHSVRMKFKNSIVKKLLTHLNSNEDILTKSLMDSFISLGRIYIYSFIEAEGNEIKSRLL